MYLSVSPTLEHNIGSLPFKGREVWHVTSWDSVHSLLVPKQKHIMMQTCYYEHAYFMATCKENRGTQSQRERPETIYNVQGHTSITHPDIPKSVIY